MRQEIASKLAECSSNREGLVALLNHLDEERRSIKSHLRLISSEPKLAGELARGRKRQEQIRKIQDKISFIQVEREAVRNKLGALKREHKSLNRVVNSRAPEFSQAFMAAAELCLSEELFVELEAKAQEILTAR